jgi:hypothetical protein
LQLNGASEEHTLSSNAFGSGLAGNLYVHFTSPLP